MPICHGCRKPISGQCVTALDRSWHPACFRCAACGRAIGDERFYTQNDQPYHANCYHARFSPRCAGCGQPITSAYTTALGKTWHPEHFVCARCKQPFSGRGFFERDGKAYCQRDYQELFGKRCAIGDEYLKGKYVVNAWGDAYCHAHARGLPECYSCQRVICQRLTGGGVRYGDGRATCNRCRRTAIDTSAQGQPVLAQVRRTLARVGLDLGRVETPLLLVGQEAMNRHAAKLHSRQPSGLARHTAKTRDGQVIERTVEAILILHGLPQEHFAAIAAHELGHSFLFTRAFPELPPLVEEGVCELAKYLWLRQQNTPEAAFRLKLMEADDDPIYGQGYRAARRSLDHMTLDALLDTVRRNGRFPA